MTDASDALATMLTRRQELVRELEEINAALRILERYGLSTSDMVDETLDQNIGIPQRDFPKIVLNVFSRFPRPMTSRQILEAMRELGISVGGADELRNLTTKLWRAKEDIARLENGTYWPKSFAMPSSTIGRRQTPN